MKQADFTWGPISRRQSMLLSWWVKGSPYADYDGIIADGAIRSGKTIAMGPSFVFWAMSSFNGRDFAICGKTIGSLRRNVINTLKRQLRAEGYKVEDRKTEQCLTVRKGSTENRFYLFGGKDEGSQDLIQGATLAGVLLDEVALMPESFVNQATARCSVDGSKFWFNCNPAGPQHWFYTGWVKRHKERNLVYLHFTMEDNLTLTQRIRARYEAQYAGVFYDRYIRGLWVAAEGVIYDMFQAVRHVCKKLPELSGEYIVSSDFGTQNATCFLLWRQEKRTGRWVCCREYYYSGRESRKQRTVAEHVDGLEAMLGGIEPAKVIVDPSALPLIAELRKRGYHVRAADNEVSAGISDVCVMLEQGLLLFYRECVRTISEFGLYCWDEKAIERGEDKPIKTNDHAMDAVRYFVRTMRLVRRRA